ncbi:low molecular weight protein-tyrosine-phosphatase [Rivibacter subsaxonicus]|uniref:protein-tyrosine-phosphatase n=1 Tax=Rivibacter subsaxonicus TaxID=457575 RepID=A0A4V2FTC8_9BURK|nr:low molecular weight protein-tyrosine-phosphatase [Rivibacter subsaxonicus]RZT97665.1 protein tyrosine phosphatase [Rivibacter subsaxonicus]
MSGDARRPPFRILMVCMGNICRSPTAEGVLRHKLQAAGLDGLVEVDSAGTHRYHVGNPPDERSQRHALRRGIDLSAQRAREVVDADFERFDLLLAMDWDNLALLEDACPHPRFKPRLRRLMEYAPAAGTEIVPDPYSGGAAGFERVLDLVELACEGLLDDLSRTLGSR